MRTENDLLMEIVHMAGSGIVAELTDVKRQALADICDAIASFLPVERAAPRSSATAADGSEPADELQGYDKFMTVAEGVKLVRFAGKDEVKLVARRKGMSGNPNTIFEIMVDKADKIASVWRDSKILFEIRGVNVSHNPVESMAVSALHSYLKYQHKRNSRRRRALKRRQAEKNMEG